MSNKLSKTSSNGAINLATDLERLRSLSGIKWQRYDDDVLPCWVADMDLAPPEVALDAIRAVVDRGDFGYNFAAAWKLGEAFSDWQDRAHGWKPNPDRVVVFSTVLHAIEVILWETTTKGDGVLVMTPIYPPFLDGIAGAGCVAVHCPLEGPDRHLTNEGMDRAITGAKAAGTPVTTILMCNPHNPTGRVFSREELGAVANIAEAHDLLVISDEVWSDLVHPSADAAVDSADVDVDQAEGRAHIPFATVSDQAAARTVTVFGPSKSFNLAGMRVAVAHMGSEMAAKALENMPPHSRGGVNVLGAEATLACWQSGHDWLAETKVHLTSQRDHLSERLASELPTIGYRVPEATYLAWLDFGPLELGADPMKFFIENGKVALSQGTPFGPLGEGFARLNFATTRTVLDEILDRMVTAVSNR